MTSLASTDALFALLAPKGELKALSSLRTMFLQHATKGTQYLDNADTLAAYRSFFFPQTFAKVSGLIEGLRYERVLDLGSAMGGAAFAAWAQNPKSKLELVDFSDAALADGQRLAAALGAQCTTRKHRLDESLPAFTQRYDLIISANALSELPFETRVQRCQQLFSDVLAPGGALLLIEPADRAHARELQALRDRLLPLGHKPSAPCPHAAPCPASVRERDFCHQAKNATFPPWFERLQQQVGISDPRMRFSYLLYAPLIREPEADLVRIISHPMKDKGRMRFLGCSARGLVELQRQDKHATQGNAGFDGLMRGALIRVGAPLADRVRIEPETKVESLSSGSDDELR